MHKYDTLIVGAGFSGATIARKLADAGKRILLIDKRSHIGGNAYDTISQSGLTYHPYGPHIFHTNDRGVFQFLSRFTNWRFYEHRVIAKLDGRDYQFPINRKTLNELYGLDLKNETDVKEFFMSVPKGPLRFADPRGVTTSEDHLYNTVGVDLTNKFFRGYTRKQWGLDLHELSSAVAARIPFRTDDDDRYFSDKFQFMPDKGYTSLFQNMLNHELITVLLNVEFREIEHQHDWKRIVYTGPVDAFFGYKFGHLPYRSLKFEHQEYDINRSGLIQSAAVVNYPDESIPFTRSTEWKWITGERAYRTMITLEYPQSEGDPYYPIPRPENAELYEKYKRQAEHTPDVYFCGRLGTYKYYNMDQVVAQALTLAKTITQNDI